MVYFVLLITENMDIEATSLSDIRSRSSNVAFGQYLSLQKMSDIQQSFVSVPILKKVYTFTSLNKLPCNAFKYCIT
jgi:hypothetical protein